jgi:hypothetical protein
MSKRVQFCGSGRDSFAALGSFRQDDSRVLRWARPQLRAGGRRGMALCCGITRGAALPPLSIRRPRDFGLGFISARITRLPLWVPPWAQLAPDGAARPSTTARPASRSAGCASPSGARDSRAPARAAPCGGARG